MIDFEDLDLGYEQCVGIYNAVTQQGAAFISGLGSNIDSLIINWKGEDATKHINGLISIHNESISFVTKTIEILAQAVEEIVQVQEARNANGSTSSFVGARVSPATDFTTKDDIQTTTEYFCDPASRQDHTKLVSLVSDYEQFANDVNAKAEELMSNWKSGNGRDKSQESFDEFENSSKKNKASMEDTAGALDQAITNLEQLM